MGENQSIKNSSMYSTITTQTNNKLEKIIAQRISMGFLCERERGGEQG
jgi:hypothetical protein